MDPNQQNLQGENDPVKKLEQDLQNLTNQESHVSPNTSDVKPVQPMTQIPIEPSVVPEIQPTQTPIQIPEESSVAQPSSMPPPVAPVEPSSPAHQISKKSSPILMVAIILAVLALLALVAYVFGAKLLAPKLVPTTTPIVEVIPTPTPDFTVTWKLYTDSENNYSLKYPAEWVQNQNAVISNITPKHSVTGATGYGITFFFINQGFSTWRDPKNVAQPSDFSIGSINGYKTYSTYSWAGEELSYNVMVEDNNRMVSFTLSPYDQSYPDMEILNTFNQIVSTFKFVEITPTAGPTVSPAASPSSSPTATP